MISRFLIAFFACTVLSGLVGCTATRSEMAQRETAPETSAPEIAEAPVIPFDEDTLYQLLVGDVALNRGEFDVAMENYLRQARQTRDAGVIELTARIAQHVHNTDAMLEMAALWLDVAPNQPAPHEFAMRAFAASGDPLAALHHAYWLFERTGNEEALLSISTLSNFQSPETLDQLLEAYRELPLPPEHRPLASFARALLYRSSGDLAAAERETRNYLEARPDNPRGILLLVQLLQERDKSGEAGKILESALQHTPDDYNLRLQYARILARTDRERALGEFERLHTDNPKDNEITYLLGLLNLNSGKTARAEELLRAVVRDPETGADARYHLGRIADLKGDAEQALRYYRQVHNGRHFLPAAARVTEIFSERGELTKAQLYLQELRSADPEQSVSLFQVESNLLVRANQPGAAISVLTAGLIQHPNDIQLLYARSMVAETQDDFSQAEHDLRAIIEQDADNAMALNALGYTMLLHTDRHVEAHQLIRRAYQLDPEDPAIIDSLGWVLFRLGDTQQALHYLQDALARAPDPEIASHLGEVQWSLGDRDAALETWRRGLQQAPGHRAIIDTMRRLGAQLDDAEN